MEAGYQATFSTPWWNPALLNSKLNVVGLDRMRDAGLDCMDAAAFDRMESAGPGSFDTWERQREVARPVSSLLARTVSLPRLHYVAKAAEPIP